MGQKLISIGLSTTLVGLFGFVTLRANAQDNDTSTQIVAVQVRKQGYQCTEPQSSQRQKDASSQHSNVWSLTCKEAKYRVTIRPNRAAVIEVIE